MNDQELITSGQLELYVAGALSPREMSDVAAYARIHSGVSNEIQRIEQALVNWLGQPVFHKPMERREQDDDIERLFARIHREAMGGGGAARSGAIASSEAIAIGEAIGGGEAIGSSEAIGGGEATASKLAMGLVAPIESVRRAPFGSRTRAAAAVAVLIIMTGVGGWLGMENMALRNRIQAIAAYQQKMEQTGRQNQARFAEMQEQMDIMRGILTRRVQLTAVSGNKITGKDNYLLIYWNPQSKKWTLADADLPGLSRNQQYQLWALYDGKPRSAGVFDASANPFVISGRQEINQAQAFAVTVEPRGGSMAPTLSNLCMMAKL